MARVVEKVALEMKDQLRVAKIVTRTMEGAKRYQELVRCMGKQLPVPSIIINGELAFKTIPGVQELKKYLKTMIHIENL